MVAAILLLAGIVPSAVQADKPGELIAVLPRLSPERAGMDSERLNVIAEVVEEGLRQEKMPGAVVLIGRSHGIVYHQAFGDRQIDPVENPMLPDTVFDLASLTKPIATATSVAILMQRGIVDPDATVATYEPDFAQNGKESITVHQLLTHQSGLIPDNAIGDYAMGPDEAFRRINALKPIAEPGERFIYSDVNFIMLGALVKKLTGQNVHEFSQQNIFQPLRMVETGYLPGEALRARAAVTEKRDDIWMQGDVHDPRAHLLGGIAGHAGLFSTASDLARYATMMLRGGELDGVRVMNPETINQMTRAYPVPGGFRGLGWDIRTGYSSNRGDLMSHRAFGHGGFTGTGIWIDPERDLYVIFLSNRVHPNGKGSVNQLIGRVGTIAAASIFQISNVPTAPIRDASHSNVLNGIDVLQRDGFQQLSGRKVGLITNQTGINREGMTSVELLHSAENVALVALFSPEHGLQGKLDVSSIADAVDESTGLKVFSLYGDSRRPTAQSLQGIDTLVFDIQDIGCRFYTYPSTMGNAMKAAAEHGLRFVVLDRVNPLGGVVVDGPLLDKGSESFVGYHTIPVQHGMTLGEYALLLKTELEIDVDLQVIKVEGWRRSELFDRCGLTWINPSPNMRNLNQAVLYPGIGLLEMTNISVGRGTDTPFEVIGAPWIDGRKLAAHLNNSGLPGIRFVPTTFTPTASKYQGELCQGVSLIITNRSQLRAVETGVGIMLTLRSLFPEAWETKNLNRLLCNQEVLTSVLNGASLEAVTSTWKRGLNEFQNRRARILLYDESN
ncbi:MAG: DUF1343 domain-containing protein [Planctomycetaceae bacterium]